MMPLKLTIRGMYSYREEQVIDFEKLTEGQVFGIFGSVGSGKSTILEAITYALYGETERMHARDGRAYNMMNLRSDEIAVEFIFKAAGERSGEYKFTFQGKRNRKRFEDVKTLDRRAFKRVEDAWEPLESADGEQVTGLSYENFRRTVIIPQGKFQEFLQLGATERTRMLREIFDLGKFELYYKVASLEAANRTALAKLEGELAQIPAVDEESLEQMTIAVAQAAEEVKHAAKVVLSAQGKVNQLAEFRKKGTELADLQSRWEKLDAKRGEWAEKEEKLNEFERCQSQFADKLIEQQQVIGRLEVVSGQKHQLKSLFAEWESKLSLAKQQKESAKIAYDLRDEWKAEKDQLEKLADILKGRKEREGLQERVENGKAEIAKQLAFVQDWESKAEESQKIYEALKASQPDVFRLSQVLKWYDELAGLEREIAQLEEDRRTEDLELANAQNAKAIKLKDAGIFLGELSLQQAVQAKIAELDARLAEAGEVWRKAEVRKEMADHVRNLREGEPCPVCGSTHHPAPGFTEEDAQAAKHYKQLRERLESEKQGWFRFESDVQMMEKVEGLHIKELSDIGSKLAAKQAALQAHSQAFAWPEYSPNDPAAAKKAQADAQALQGKVSAAEDKAKESRTEKEKAEKTLRNYEAKVQEFADEAKGLAARAETLLGQLPKGFAEAHGHKDVATLTAEAEKLGKQWTAAGQQMQAAEKAFDQADQGYRQSEKDLFAAENEWKLLSGRSKEIEEILAVRLAAEGFESLAQVREILSRKWDVKAERAALEAWRKALQEVELGKARLEAELQGQQVSETEWEAAEAALAEARKHEQEWNQQLGTLKAQQQEMERHFALRKDLAAQYAALSLRAQNLGELSKLFKASGFVTYVSSIFLQELLVRANDRFAKLTHHQLYLELGPDNDFLVRDLLNGGATRSVKTLSGGQTFQAALCLALALSDSLQRQKGGGHNFFFMDEGFGSLDSESLRVVFETLTSLRKENRVVGIISHVEALQQEIGTYIRIRNDEDRGSLVEASWD